MDENWGKEEEEEEEEEEEVVGTMMYLVWSPWVHRTRERGVGLWTGVEACGVELVVLCREGEEMERVFKGLSTLYTGTGFN